VEVALTPCHYASTTLFTAYPGEHSTRRNAIGELVPADHYDTVFHSCTVSDAPHRTETQCHADRRESVAVIGPLTNARRTETQCHADRREASRCMALRKHRVVRCVSRHTQRKTQRPAIANTPTTASRSPDRAPANTFHRHGPYTGCFLRSPSIHSPGHDLDFVTVAVTRVCDNVPRIPPFLVMIS